MSKLDIIALSGVVYKVKSTGPSTERNSIWECDFIWQSVFNFDALVHNLQIRRKTKFKPGQISHTNQEVYISMC